MGFVTEVNDYDVVICGSGSAGLCAAVWLARFGIKFKVLERQAGPMERGQADGVQCRTVEVFESFGISEEMLRESYHVLEVVFWASDAEGKIKRERRTPDTPPGLSHQPHVILNQARVNGLFIEAMKKAGGPDIGYNYEVKGVDIDSTQAHDPQAHCVTVTASRDGKEEKLRAKYVLACDGAHSVVRRALGIKMVGDSSDHIWGVMDVYPQTNFPDIRRKTTIRSEVGSLLIIPREGDSLVRFYIELPEGTQSKDVRLEQLQAQARKIFYPYTMDFADTYWWSAYAIGQRLAENFEKDHRVFLTGDSCHTHSAKAGQGMNVSLQDGYNIGWKLGQILHQQVSPKVLETYVLERGKVAADLIEFDRYFTRIWSSNNQGKRVSAEEFSDGFTKALKYTAGLTAKYDDSPITSAEGSKPELAKNLSVGMRFPSTHVVRFSDMKPMQLVRALPSDGRWRVVIFCGNATKSQTLERLEKLASYLDGPDGLVRTFTPANADIDSFVEPILISSGDRFELDQERIPGYFWPETGKWKMRDLHKVYVDDQAYDLTHGHAYEFYGVDKEVGAIAIVRPDQYISKICEVDNLEAIGSFFKGFTLPVKGVTSNGDTATQS